MVGALTSHERSLRLILRGTDKLKNWNYEMGFAYFSYTKMLRAVVNLDENSHENSDYKRTKL